MEYKRFAKSYMLSVSEIIEEMSKIKLKQNKNAAGLFGAIANIENQVRKI